MKLILGLLFLTVPAIAFAQQQPAPRCQYSYNCQQPPGQRHAWENWGDKQGTKTEAPPEERPSLFGKEEWLNRHF